MAKNGKGAKTPKLGNISPETGKRPKLSDPPIEGKPLAWRFSACDKGGPFGWDGLAPDAKHRLVIDRLHAFERMSWDQLHAAKCHPIEIKLLEKAARSRLVDIQRDDIDALMSFHIAGAERIWCVQDANIMRVLWWDPRHEVYKTEKDKGDRKKRHIREGR